MDRREFILAGAASLVAPKFLLNKSDPHKTVLYSGWLANPEVGDTRPLCQQVDKAFAGSGEGKIVLLYKYLIRMLGGRFIPHDQQGKDCIGHAFGVGVDTLAAVQIYGLGLKEKFIGEASTEAIYAGSRYEIGYLVHKHARILNLGGSWGIYAAEYLRDYGVLVRKRYGDIDLTKYNPRLAREWGRDGIPDELEPIAKQHPVRHFALVQSYADCRDAIANGYPVILCSSVGFNPECEKHNPSGGRDKDGFLNKCGKWYHSMVAVAVDDTKRPGLLAINSWGSNWLKGPTRFSQPVGSFWIDADTVDEMCEEQDSVAIGGLVGFRKNPELNYRLL